MFEYVNFSRYKPFFVVFLVVHDSNGYCLIVHYDFTAKVYAIHGGH